MDHLVRLDTFGNCGSAPGQNCVEVATNLPGIVAIRDSKNPGGPELIVSHHEWTALICGVRRGEFEGM
jgi:uncharacterized protein DUF397